MIEFFVEKETFLKKLNFASRFLRSRITTSLPSGVLLKIKGNKLIIIASNLNSFYQGEINLEEKVKNETEFVIDPKDIIDFINLLLSEKIKLIVDEKKVIVKDDKNQGVFQRIQFDDYPVPSLKIEEKQKIEIEKWQKIIPQIVFAASKDDSRPVLTGIYFKSEEEKTDLVATDGFRLSLYQEKEKINLPSMIIPADFLEEMMRIGKNKEVYFSFLSEEKLVVFQIDNDFFASQLIEGEFPPYEKVIPKEIKTKIVVEKEELLRNTKLIAIFARSFSNIIIFEVKKDELILRPKTTEEETLAHQELIEFEGEEQKVAFNYKFILEFLNNIEAKEIEINILKPDAPVVFRPKNNQSFIHIIMPVRLAD